MTDKPEQSPPQKTGAGIPPELIKKAVTLLAIKLSILAIILYFVFRAV